MRSSKFTPVELRDNPLFWPSKKPDPVPHSFKMPFGKYQGLSVGSIPVSYLEWLATKELRPGKLKDYITQNILKG